MQEFMEAFGSIINRDGSMTQDQIARLFMQIDANSDGGIDWNEFSTYMLMESQVIDQYTCKRLPLGAECHNIGSPSTYEPTHPSIHRSLHFNIDHSLLQCPWHCLSKPLAPAQMLAIFPPPPPRCRAAKWILGSRT